MFSRKLRGIEGMKKGQGFYTPAGIGPYEVSLVRYLEEGDFVAFYVRY